MSDQPNLLDAGEASMARRNRILTFLEEREPEVTTWLASIDAAFSFREFLTDFRARYLPWLWDEEVAELCEITEGGSVYGFMETWDELMAYHPDRREAFWENQARDEGLLDELRRARQYDRLVTQIGKLQAENAALKALAAER